MSGGGALLSITGTGIGASNVSVRGSWSLSVLVVSPSSTAVAENCAIHVLGLLASIQECQWVDYLRHFKRCSGRERCLTIA